ncbi:MAG: HAD family phosphatase [Candidatus Aminicenantaceae bacterium]
MKIKCVIFDMDGTLIEAPYDWNKIRSDLDTRGKPILAYISELDEPERSLKWEILEKYEHEATLNATIKEGIPELMDFLEKSGILRFLVTNNSKKNVSFLLDKFNLEFEYVLTREIGLWKPSGAPFLAALRAFNIAEEECCTVGDSEFDIKAGVDAGIPNIFILNPTGKNFESTQAEMFVSIEDIQKKIESLVGEACLS